MDPRRQPSNLALSPPWDSRSGFLPTEKAVLSLGQRLNRRGSDYPHYGQWLPGAAGFDLWIAWPRPPLPGGTPRSQAARSRSVARQKSAVSRRDSPGTSRVVRAVGHLCVQRCVWQRVSRDFETTGRCFAPSRLLPSTPCAALHSPQVEQTVLRESWRCGGTIR
jgi:hypothetical protein